MSRIMAGSPRVASQQPGQPETTASPKKMDDATKKQSVPFRRTAWVGAIAVFSGLGSFLFGLDIGYIGPIIECGDFRTSVVHIAAGAKIDPGYEGLIVSLFSLGAIVMAFPVISSYFVDVWGRKLSIVLGGWIFIVGSIVQATAGSTAQMLIGRFISGLSVGLLSCVVVLYQSEMAPANLRGAFSTLYQFMITFGILVATAIDEALVARAGGWRWVIFLMCVPALVLSVGMMFLPRSPRWLVQRGDKDKALTILLSLRSDEDARTELSEIVSEQDAADKMGQPRWIEIFQGKIGRLLLLGVTLQLLQQLVGMNAFMYFGPKIFKGIGFSGNLFTTINNLVNFLSTIPAVLLADVAGRRTLMLCSSVGMALACTMMGAVGMATMTVVVNAEGDEHFTVSNETAKWTIAFSVFFFVFNFAYGCGPIVWTYVAEIYPLKYRARCIGVCTLANWVGNFIIAEFTPILLDSLRFGTFFVFGFFCIVLVFLSTWLPETKGVQLESVGQLFDHKVGFRSFAPANEKCAAEETGTASEVCI
jgi:sugar porter (SP) family MFS transporter